MLSRDILEKTKWKCWRRDQWLLDGAGGNRVDRSGSLGVKAPFCGPHLPLLKFKGRVPMVKESALLYDNLKTKLKARCGQLDRVRVAGVILSQG